MNIAVLGGYGVGLTMRLDHLPTPGETVTGGELSRGPGGKGSNQAIGMARLGATVQLLTAVGRDGEGAEAEGLWASEAVGAGYVARTDAPTMTGFILVDTSGENSITIAPGALQLLAIDDVERYRPAIAAADMLVVSLEVPIAAAVRALEIAREVGTRTLLNPAPVPTEGLPASIWPLVDVLTPNRTEAERLVGSSSPTAQATAIALASMTGATVVLTLGGEGVAIVERGSTVQIPPVPVLEVVDTTGAGDAFTAALAVALCSGATVADSSRWAAEAGAFCVGRDGVVPALPRSHDLPALVTP